MNNGKLDIPKGSIQDYILSTHLRNISRISATLWIYRNRKRMDKFIIKALSQDKDGRRLLRKYKIKFKKS
jgi:hypothetical protein